MYIFAPAASTKHIPRHVANKIERWALTLAAYLYTIIHIPGDANTWADLLTRWIASEAVGSLAPLRCTLAAITRAPLAPSTDFAWPTKPKLQAAQEAALTEGETLPQKAFQADGLWRTRKGATWVPAKDTGLQLRLCIIGHCGRAGHRAARTTLKNMQPHVWWKSMREDVLSFCNTCLHCQTTSGGRRTPQPLAHALHADKPNELLHFDYLFMSPSDAGEQYVLIVKDDASSFIWLEPTEAADAHTTAKVLTKWASLFGNAPMWCSDRGTHFKNEVIRLVNRRLYARHHFTTAYCPQSNGTVEAVCKEVLRACRALLSEFQLKE